MRLASLAPCLALVACLGLAPWPAPAATSAPAGDTRPRHLIYLHGRIVQDQQTARPRHPEHGYYELEQILEAFRKRGFLVSGAIRPKQESLDESAESVAREVQGLIASGVAAPRITIVGGSMGAAIALRSSLRLQKPALRFAVLGACMSRSVPSLMAEYGRRPAGRILAIRERSDETSEPCPAWRDDADPGATLAVSEIVLDTGLRHGFLYRPLPEWVEPVVQWATAP